VACDPGQEQSGAVGAHQPQPARSHALRMLVVWQRGSTVKKEHPGPRRLGRASTVLVVATATALLLEPTAVIC